MNYYHRQSTNLAEFLGNAQGCSDIDASPSLIARGAVVTLRTKVKEVRPG